MGTISMIRIREKVVHIVRPHLFLGKSKTSFQLSRSTKQQTIYGLYVCASGEVIFKLNGTVGHGLFVPFCTHVCINSLEALESCQSVVKMGKRNCLLFNCQCKLATIVGTALKTPSIS